MTELPAPVRSRWQPLRAGYDGRRLGLGAAVPPRRLEAVAS